MANVFDELYKLTHTPEAIAARQARRGARRTDVFDRIAEALGKKTADSWDIQDLQLEHRPLGDMHPGSAATMYVREALSQFEIPDMARVEYSGMKRQSGSGAHHLKDGVVLIKAELRSLSGAKHHIDVPVMVHEGYMVYPEIFMHNGRVRVMAQSAFDEIIDGGEIMRGETDRKHMFAPPPSHEDAQRSREVPPTPQMGAGMYGRFARAAMRGYDKTAMPDERGHMGNSPAESGLDEAERDQSNYLSPGQAITLANEIMLKGRGGTMSHMAKGTKGTVVRDMMGTGQVYYVEFDSGCCAPVNKDDLA